MKYESLQKNFTEIEVPVRGEPDTWSGRNSQAHPGTCK